MEESKALLSHETLRPTPCQGGVGSFKRGCMGICDQNQKAEVFYQWGRGKGDLSTLRHNMNFHVERKHQNQGSTTRHFLDDSGMIVE